MYRYPAKQAKYLSQINSSSGNCPFCGLDKVELGHIKRKIIEETNLSIVVNNLYPYNIWEGLEVTEHLMVLPKRHVGVLNELTPTERVDLMDLCCQYGSRHYDLYNRSPTSKIRSVLHLHFHLIKTANKHAKHIEINNDPYDLKVTW